MTAKDKSIGQLVESTGLQSSSQKRNWARVSALRLMLQSKGILTEEDMEEMKKMEQAMLRDINRKIEARIRNKPCTFALKK
jgi:hypothetical protein